MQPLCLRGKQPLLYAEQIPTAIAGVVAVRDGYYGIAAEAEAGGEGGASFGVSAGIEYEKATAGNLTELVEMGRNLAVAFHTDHPENKASS